MKSLEFEYAINAATDTFFELTKQPPVIPRTERKLRSFIDLPKGWHFGEGGPASADLVDQAVDLERHARRLGFLNADAFPGTGEAFSLVVYWRDTSYEFIFSANEIELTQITDGALFLDRDGLDLNDCKKLMTEEARKIWRMLGFYTRETGIPDSNDLPASPSETQPAVVYQSSNSAAQWSPA